MKKITERNIDKFISEAVLKSNINFTITDIDKKEVLYTTKDCYKTFGMNEHTPYKDALRFWLDNIVHPEDREMQEDIFNSGVVPQKRVYRIIHPERGIRFIRVDVSDIISIYGRNIVVSLPIDITTMGD